MNIHMTEEKMRASIIGVLWLIGAIWLRLTIPEEESMGIWGFFAICWFLSFTLGAIVGVIWLWQWMWRSAAELADEWNKRFYDDKG